MGKNGKSYTSEFKNQAVKLSHNSDKPIREVADRLGISKSSLYRWRAMFTADFDKAFPDQEKKKGQDMSSVSIISIDSKERIIDLNQAAEHMLGYSRVELLQQEITRFIVPSSQKGEQDWDFAQYMTTDEEYSLGKQIELVARCADNSELPINATIIRAFSDGSPVITVVIQVASSHRRDERVVSLLVDNNQVQGADTAPESESPFDKVRNELEKRIQDQNDELKRVKETVQAKITEQVRADKEFYHQDDTRSGISDFVKIEQVIRAVLKWWWLLILAGIIGAAIGYGISQRVSPVYQATATLMVGQSILSTNLDSRDIQTSELLAVTYADIARREPVLQGVIEVLGLDANWQQLKKQVKVSHVNGTQLLEIVVEAKSPQEAEKIANEIAHQLILASPTTLQNQESNETTSFVQQRLDNLRKRIENGQRQIEALDRAMTTMTTTSEMSALQDEINTLEGLIANWEADYIQLLNFVQNDNPVNYLAVIEEAHARLTPIRPLVKLNTLLAGVVGLFLALALIFTLEYLDDSIKSTDDLSRILNLIPLGAIGQINGKHTQDRLITSQGFLSPVSEAYRMIRTNLQFISVDRACKTIMITSATPGEGKSTTAANLGIVMAHAGLETIIVDADLRRPTQHRIFQLRTQKGLTDLIRQPEPNIDHHLITTKVAHLHVLTSGPLPPNPSEILGSQRMKCLLARLKEMADVVIVDSPPLAAFADAAVLSNRVDGVVLVIKAGKTKRDIVKSTIPILRQAGANFLGVVLNGISIKQVPSYYGHYYSTGSADAPGKLPVYVRLVNRLK